MTKVREHRGGLAESMETVREVADHAELVRIIAAELAPFGKEVTADMVRARPYIFDERIGWDTYLIVVDGYGVWGMSNGPL